MAGVGRENSSVQAQAGGMGREQDTDAFVGLVKDLIVPTARGDKQGLESVFV